MPEESNLAPLLTSDQVAEILGVPKQTLLEWRARGRPSPRAIKIGKYLRFREEDVVAFIESRMED